MKQLMILAAVVAAGILMTTGCCSTCGKKDGACAKPTAATGCTNTLAADFRLACSGSCTNQFNAYLAACPSECTNKPSGGKS